MVPFSYTWNKIAPLSYTSRISQNNRIFHNRHFFPGFSVVLIQLRSHFCHNVTPFDILLFSHHLFHFAADFVTLSYTKMAIFYTLKYTVSLKKAPLSGGASPYSPLKGVPYPPPDVITTTAN